MRVAKSLISIMVSRLAAAADAPRSEVEFYGGGSNFGNHRDGLSPTQRSHDDTVVSARGNAGGVEKSADPKGTISAHVYHEIRNVVGAILSLDERIIEMFNIAAAATSPPTISELRLEVTPLISHQRLVCGHAIDILNGKSDDGFSLS